MNFKTAGAITLVVISMTGLTEIEGSQKSSKKRFNQVASSSMGCNHKDMVFLVTHAKDIQKQIAEKFGKTSNEDKIVEALFKGQENQPAEPSELRIGQNEGKELLLVRSGRNQHHEFHVIKGEDHSTTIRAVSGNKNSGYDEHLVVVKQDENGKILSVDPKAKHSDQPMKSDDAKAILSEEGYDPIESLRKKSIIRFEKGP